MNEQFGMTIGLGVIIFIGWVAAYFLCWCVQCCWAWVDDSNVSHNNWLSANVAPSKWKYPVYNGYGQSLDRAVKNKEKPFGYAKNKDFSGTGINDKQSLERGVDYKYSHDVYSGLWVVALASSIAPVALLVAYSLYAITLFFVSTALIMYISRMIVRHKKLFDKHIKDTDAHK